jgi:DNA mismatch repair protein MutS
MASTGTEEVGAGVSPMSPFEDRPGGTRPSVLFGRLREDPPDLGEVEPPDFFPDLLLDQLVAAVASKRKGCELEEFFSLPLRDADAVVFRQDVMRDVDRDPVREALEAFTEAMTTHHRYLELGEHVHDKYAAQRWFLDAEVVYAEAVSDLAEELADLDVRSRGLRAIGDYLARYVASEPFEELVHDASQVRELLDGVEYDLQIKGPRVTVSRHEEGRDLSDEVRRTFARFERTEEKSYRANLSAGFEISPVESRILELIARLFPGPFAALETFCDRHRDHVDEVVSTFDREIQFYLAYREFISHLRAAGLSFCYPTVSTRSKDVRVEGAFDIVLADKLRFEGGEVVANDFELSGVERILVVTGPNQGGKTTFARMFGQVHYLASLGLPIPGRDARLFLPDRIFTQFPREESIRTLRGRLEDELVLSRAILRQATESSVIVANEALTATTLDDALFLGSEVLGRLVGLDALGVWVTFVDELSSLGPSTVSMVAIVDPTDPSSRTYRIERMPADGRAYAAAVARAHRLTDDAIRERIAR